LELGIRHWASGSGGRDHERWCSGATGGGFDPPVSWFADEALSALAAQSCRQWHPGAASGTPAQLRHGSWHQCLVANAQCLISNIVEDNANGRDGNSGKVAVVGIRHWALGTRSSFKTQLATWGGGVRAQRWPRFPIPGLPFGQTRPPDRNSLVVQRLRSLTVAALPGCCGRITRGGASVIRR
jgi:hypothetical protein